MTTRVPRLSTLVLFFPRYGAMFRQYLDWTSASTQNFMPNLSGLFGINCVNGQRALVGKSCSSMSMTLLKRTLFGSSPQIYSWAKKSCKIYHSAIYHVWLHGCQNDCTSWSPRTVFKALFGDKLHSHTLWTIVDKGENSSRSYTLSKNASNLSPKTSHGELLSSANSLVHLVIWRSMPSSTSSLNASTGVDIDWAYAVGPGLAVKRCELPVGQP